MTDWYARCAYDPEVKQRFHTAARARLRRLATTLRFPLGSFDLRSNLGGIAVSGEITLHHDDVNIQVWQPASGADSGILIRTCQGRRDYTGGRNHLAPLRLLDDALTLAAQVRAVMATKTSAHSAAPSSRRSRGGRISANGAIQSARGAHANCGLIRGPSAKQTVANAGSASTRGRGRPGRV
jgi:hypothetical protein